MRKKRKINPALEGAKARANRMAMSTLGRARAFKSRKRKELERDYYIKGY